MAKFRLMYVRQKILDGLTSQEEFYSSSQHALDDIIAGGDPKLFALGGVVFPKAFMQDAFIPVLLDGKWVDKILVRYIPIDVTGVELEDFDCSDEPAYMVSQDCDEFKHCGCYYERIILGAYPMGAS